MLDTSVTNLSLITIASDLKLDVYYSSWIMTAFGTGLVISFSLASLSVRIISADLALLIACFLFSLASMGCALSETTTEFLGYRFLQGLCSGIGVVTAQSLLVRALGEKRKAMAVSLWGSAFSLAPVAGPLVGAWVTDTFSWHWLFLMNLPLTCLSVFILMPMLKLEKYDEPFESGIFISLFCFALAIASFQFTLDFGEQYGWLADERITFALMLLPISAIVFMCSNQHYQLFDFSVFRDWGFAFATIASCLGNGLIFSSLILLPIWLQKDYQMPILTAGLIVSVASAVAVILVPLMGKYLQAKLFASAAIASLVFSGYSFYLMSQFQVDTSVEEMIMARLVAGIGLSIFTMPLTMLALKNIPAEKIANANAVTMMLRVVSANIFVALSFYSFVQLQRQYLLETSANVDNVTILKYMDGVPPTVMQYLSYQAGTSAMSDIFILVFWIFIAASILLIPLSFRRK